jgi:isoleucyl-tRNA synthetase
MTDPVDTPAKDWRDTVFLPKTDFPMKAGLPQKEPGILARWQDQDIYRKLREDRRGRPKFILHDGPPYANGDMHIGHALNHILKDMVCRTQSLLGKDAPYVPGWDCHGLPIEWKVEEEYRKKKRNKDEVPVEEFRAECRAYAQHWVNVQREQVKRLGVLGNWDKPYLTMDFDSEATIVSELLKFAESGQLYRGAKPVMWSPVEKTALAEAEVEYEDITSTQIDVAFEITESLDESFASWLDVAKAEGGKVWAVIWTTTPWTIPINQALAYGPDITYVLAHVGRDYFVIAEELLNDTLERASKSPWLSRGSGWNISWVGKGSDLAGTIARHPMAKLFDSPLPFRGGAGGGECPPDSVGSDAPHPNPSPEGEGLNFDPTSPLAEFFLRPRPFLPGDFVTTDSGTGLVHMAPDHGEDDFDLCKAHGIEPVFAVEGDGKYRADWGWLGGQGSVINKTFNSFEGPILQDLHKANALLAHGDFNHSYPHSWRSKAKVIYRCTPQWFVGMDRPVKPLPQAGGVGEGLSSSPPLAPPASGVGKEAGFGQGIPATLRELATAAIANTRFVPEKGRNRIGSMVEGRPDWVLSRQRVWGVPITLFVDRKTGQYLNDPAVNARIVEAIKTEGVDAWEAARAQDYLGSDYRADDYEMVTDILDVWFDSGCTHVFTLESGKWPELKWPADLYLEGSDQHRGWFQSSLLESCGTRGRAPYNAVLTHGFTMDQKGMKMSKSLGNTINPLDLMRNYGADILRLWALSVDFTEDHRIGKEILQGVSDQYRKLRNTFRYLLGALDGFSDSEKVAVADMPELERYVLHLLADMNAKLKMAVNDFDFNSYVRLITDFANNDLSAFFFDIRKDSLYCDAATNPKRMAYRTVLDILFHAMVRYAAPMLVFTSEEVWGTRFPDADSVHLLEWPEVDADWVNEPLKAKWEVARNVRGEILAKLEEDRREKRIGSSLQANVDVVLAWEGDGLGIGDLDLAELAIVSDVTFKLRDPEGGYWCDVTTSVTENHKCGRCWRHLPEVAEDGALCGRCEAVVDG